MSVFTELATKLGHSMYDIRCTMYDVLFGILEHIVMIEFVTKYWTFDVRYTMYDVLSGSFNNYQQT